MVKVRSWVIVHGQGRKCDMTTSEAFSGVLCCV